MEPSTPTKSILPGAGLRDSGTRKSAATTPMTVTGTLIRKTEPHQKCVSSRPPSTGPIATPMPTAEVQMPMARARSPGSKTLAMMDRVCGMTAAPPRPMTARAAMSWSGECE